MAINTSVVFVRAFRQFKRRGISEVEERVWERESDTLSVQLWMCRIKCTTTWSSTRRFTSPFLVFTFLPSSDWWLLSISLRHFYLIFVLTKLNFEMNFQFKSDQIFTWHFVNAMGIYLQSGNFQALNEFIFVSFLWNFLPHFEHENTLTLRRPRPWCTVNHCTMYVRELAARS